MKHKENQNRNRLATGCQLAAALLLAALPLRPLAAQDTTVYQSIFGDSVATWEGTVQGYFGARGMMHSIFTDDDTVIDGITYHPMRTVEPYYVVSNLQVLVRESENHDKVFVREKIGQSISPELLAMDLSLAVGDTLNTDSWRLWTWIDTIPTITIDSVFFVDSQKYLRTSYVTKFYDMINWRTDTLFFIEGVGPSMGFSYLAEAMHHEYAISCGLFVHCYSRDRIAELYHTQEYYNYGRVCIDFWQPDGFIDISRTKVSVYPNPSKSHVTVSGFDSSEAEYDVFDHTGRLEMQGKLFPSNQIIDIGDLPCGVHFLRITNDSGNITTKIIKAI